MSEKNKKTSRRKYDASFKTEVLKMVESGRPVPEIAHSMGISENLVYQWRIRSGASGNFTANPSERGEFSAENDRLRAELRRTEMERDILKKALGIFSRGT